MIHKSLILAQQTRQVNPLFIFSASGRRVIASTLKQFSACIQKIAALH